MPDSTTDISWRNGETLPFDKLALPVWDLGVVAGASITEMARTFRHAPFRLADHIERLVSSCHELGFSVAYSSDELVSAAEGVVSNNATGLAEQDDLGIVVFATAGANATYLGGGELPDPHVVIHTFRLPFELWRKAATTGLDLVVPDRFQADTDSLPVHLKTRNRLHWWLADREAAKIRPTARALLLDRNGLITETSTSCFYATDGKTIVTPAEGVLNSMSRRLVKEAAAAAGLNFEARSLTLSDLDGFTELFVSSTPVGLLPVGRLNDREWPVLPPDSVVPGLLQHWQQQTGLNPLHQIRNSAPPG